MSWAQAPAPRFDVASVRADDTPFKPPSFALSQDDSFRDPHARFHADFQVAIYLQFAYKLWLTGEEQKEAFANVPDWVRTQRFDIEATAPLNATKDDYRAMVRALLEERFALKMHFVNKCHGPEPRPLGPLRRSGRSAGNRQHPARNSTVRWWRRGVLRTHPRRNAQRRRRLERLIVLRCRTPASRSSCQAIRSVWLEKHSPRAPFHTSQPNGRAYQRACVLGRTVRATCWTLAKRSLDYVVDDASHELGTAFYVRGRGLVVIGSCSHRGIINTVHRAQAVSGVEKIHAIVGGFHLVAPQTHQQVMETLAMMQALNPSYIIPGHCTGEDFIQAATQALPGKVVRSQVGRRFIFPAA